MVIKNASLSDLQTILNLLEIGRQKMIASGNLYQWKKGYPSEEVIKNDILQNNSYLIFNHLQKPIATFAFILGKEPTYEYIENGNWLNAAPYGTLHRIASIEGAKGIMSYIIDFCSKQINNIRIDTHKDNLPMRKALEKLHFTYCGIIFLTNGEQRIAYQRVFE